ncbi:dihydrolipoyl dehydrogenase [Candidatus Peregrinibacteria bacterium]|nr:dihydrolipoyl dehydrogenase [Candidatus Peregrinibacteria bacterium]
MSFDVIIIGAGPGGCRAANVLASAGKSVALISQTLGGECLNYGCIPTKTYLWTTELFEKISQSQNFGLKTTEIKLDWEAMKQRRKQVVEKLKKGLKFTLERAGVKIIEGTGALQDASTITVTQPSTLNQEPSTLSASHIILATGSWAVSPKGFETGGKIVSSREILDLPQVPQKLLIIGGGAIGVEFASIFSTLGSQVTIAEMADRLIPNEDPDVSAELARLFARKNIIIKTKTLITPEQITDYDCVLVAVGRKPVTQGLGLERSGIRTGEHGVIETNDFFQTSAPAIFAIGDLAGKALLAYSAEREADIAAAFILGKKPKPLLYSTVPNTIFSSPEIASIGLTEPAARQKGMDIIIGKAPYSANAKALIVDSRDGFAKIIAEKSSHKILGIHIIGEKATELIAEASLAITYKLTLEDFAENIHSHPILGEILKDACEAALFYVRGA